MPPPRIAQPAAPLPHHQGAGPGLPGLRPGPLRDPESATKAALGALARRWQHRQAELDALDVELTKLVSAAAPALLALPGIGLDTAGQLLVTAGTTRGGWAARPPSPGCVAWPHCPPPRTDRHRLNRGGDRHANHALWRITLVRMHCHEPTKTDVQRRTHHGLSKLDILRCLKRYIAREVDHHLVNQPDPSPGCQK